MARLGESGSNGSAVTTPEDLLDALDRETWRLLGELSPGRRALVAAWLVGYRIWNGAKGAIVKQKWHKPEATVVCPSCGQKFLWSVTIWCRRRPKIQVVVRRGE